MKTTLLNLRWLVLIALFVPGFAWVMQAAQNARAAPTAASPQAAIGTTFTYQGQLTLVGEPVEDDCLMRFTLFDAESGGSQVGSPYTSPTPIAVHQGRFSVPLDFGSVFTGTALWLQVEVKCSGDSAYSGLGRQALTATPYAVNATLLAGQPHSYYQDASNLNAGTLATGLYSAHADLAAEGYLGNANGDLAQNNGTLQSNLNADLLDGQSQEYYQNASNLNAGTLATGLYSAYADLDAEGYLTNGSGSLAQNNGTLQGNLNADLLDGVQGGFYERSYLEGTLDDGGTLTIVIPHYYPFTLQLASGWPDYGGLAFIMGFENDRDIAVTYILYNGDGTSELGRVCLLVY
ncbi:MAG: hypothetical protein JW862_11445 [Anaerolineales bacterium]|nr:hypothetical protein [Anaerolineales bacterium]